MVAERSTPYTTGADGSDTPGDRLAAQVRGLATRLSDDIDRLDLDTARDRLDALAELEGAVAAATIRTVHRYAQLGGVRGDGATSTTAWLRDAGNRAQSEAARLGRLSAMADDLPDTLDAVATGEVSLASADIIARAIKDDRLGDDTEQQLLDLAHTESPETLRAHVKRETQRRDGDAMRRDEQRQHRARRVSLTEQRDGMWRLDGQLPHEQGIKARTLLDALTTKDPEDTPEDQRRSFVQRTADAFNDLVDLGLDHGDLPDVAGQSRPHVVAVTDLATTTHDFGGDHQPATDDPRWADLPGARTDWSEHDLSPQAVRRITCDASTVTVTVAGGQVLSVGRATPSWTGPQRTAIRVRDGHCRGPGCDRPIPWTQIHHVRWWRDGGPTDVSNGIALCHHCHHKIHDLDWTVTLDPTSADATWTSPTGRTTTTRPRGRPRSRRRPA